MPTTFPSSPDLPGVPRMSQAASYSSPSDRGGSFGSDERRFDQIHSGGNERSHAGKHRWFSQVKDWISVSEPSAQAMKAQKRTIKQKHGIDPEGPMAAAKLHFPIGQVPTGATTSTRGPTPEKALKKKATERQMRQTYMGYTHTSHSHSISSSISSNYTKHD